MVQPRISSSSGATVDSTLVSAAHDRQRRSERRIQKIDLQRARRYGMAEHQTNGRIKYTYGGVVFIYCPIMNAAVTSWKVSEHLVSQTSGTTVTQPIHLAKHTFNNSSRILAENERYHERLTLLLNSSNISHTNNAATAAANNKWTSHSVLVVDMSGSMCRDDVNGARCRSDGV